MQGECCTYITSLSFNLIDIMVIKQYNKLSGMIFFLFLLILMDALIFQLKFVDCCLKVMHYQKDQCSKFGVFVSVRKVAWELFLSLLLFLEV